MHAHDFVSVDTLKRRFGCRWYRWCRRHRHSGKYDWKINEPLNLILWYVFIHNLRLCRRGKRAKHYSPLNARDLSVLVREGESDAVGHRVQLNRIVADVNMVNGHPLERLQHQPTGRLLWFWIIPLDKDRGLKRLESHSTSPPVQLKPNRPLCRMEATYFVK